MAALDSRWRRDDEQQQGGKWNEDERELYESARNAASAAEREGDAQLQAAVAAARVVNQAVVAPTHLDFWSLKFECGRLEAAYRRKSTTNSEYYDYVPVLFKIVLFVPHLLLCVLWLLRSPTTHVSLKRDYLSWSQPELTFHELWSIIAAITCLLVLGVQLIWPMWYRSNRGTTLKYLVMSLWAWESVKLLLNTNDTKYVLMEVVFVNVFMGALHRIPFFAHLQMRSYGGAMQSLAIACKGVNLKQRLQILSLAMVGHMVGLGLAYILDRYSRKQFLQSLPVWLLDDLVGNRSQTQFYLSYRASLSRQMWSIFYPELLDDPQSNDKAVTNIQITPPRRALGGFAGGFGGVSSLKCMGPISAVSTISSSSSFSEDGSSDSSSGHWGGIGQTGSGISCGETAQEFSGNFRRASVQLSMAATASACSQVGMEQSRYVQSRVLRKGISRRYH